MAATDDRLEEEIRAIIESGEDSTLGWSDQGIVTEASRRIGNGADAIDDVAMRRWVAMIPHFRSATDNDGQTRV